MHAQLIDKALKKYGSVRAIATALEIDQSNLNKSVRAQKLTPQIAYALAKDLGENEILALVEGMKYSARSERERQYWAAELLSLLGVK